MNEILEKLTDEDWHRVIKHQIDQEKITWYSESLKVPLKELEQWKLSCPVPKVKYPAAHEWQRRITYPYEEVTFDQFQTAIYYLYFAGNKGGKTVWGSAWVGMECLGLHPLQELGIRPKPPLHWWVVSPNLPSESEVPRGEDAPILKKFYDYIPDMQITGSPWGIKKFYRKDKLMTIVDVQGNESVVNFKSHDQEKGKFKSEDLDGIYWDEEPPKPLWEEGVPRILSKKGIFLLAMTPDYGSWTFSLLKHKTDPQYYIVEMDCLDNPYMPAEHRKMILDTMSEDQQMMRRKGLHIQMKGKVFPFDHGKNVGRPFQLTKDCTYFVIIDWHPAKPIYISYLAINPKGIWYVFRESKVEQHTDDAISKAYYVSLILPDFKIEPRKNIIDKLANVKQVQKGGYRPVSIIDMLRDKGIRCEAGNDEFGSAHAWLCRKLIHKELWFDPDCKEHIEQWDTWGAKRYLHGNLEGTLRDQLETEGNDTCMNMVYAYNAGAKWYPKFDMYEDEQPFRPRSSTSLLYRGVSHTKTWAERQREKDLKEGWV